MKIVIWPYCFFETFFATAIPVDLFVVLPAASVQVTVIV